MSIIEMLEEFTLALVKCNKSGRDCEHCRYVSACLDVFSKKTVSEEIEELAAQCKAFNEFARANQRGDK